MSGNVRSRQFKRREGNQWHRHRHNKSEGRLAEYTVAGRKKVVCDDVVGMN
jgi:hypothetical protein